MVAEKTPVAQYWDNAEGPQGAAGFEELGRDALGATKLKYEQ